MAESDSVKVPAPAPVRDPVTPTGVAQREDTAVPVSASTLGAPTTATQETP